MQAITEAMRNKLGQASGLGATVKFDCGPDGFVFVDGKSRPNTVSNENRAADCTVTMSRGNLVALMKGELNPATSYMTGQLKISGDMSVALKLQRIV